MTTAASLPILDLSDFTDGAPVQREAFVARLRETAHHIGFFYLTGLGVPPGQVQELVQTARAFFALPDADKQAIHMANSPHFRGYTRAGDEITRGERDWREQLDIGAERGLWEAASATDPWQRLQGPNQWPASLPALRTVTLAWQDRLTGAARQLLRALALALGQPEGHFDEAFAGTPMLHTKVIHYPGRAPGESTQGVGAHKDSGCLTLLLQDTEAGLQVLEREGPGEPRWIDVPPLPGTVVINLGEVLEILTQGYLRATTHRVVSPASGVSRLSVAYFISPRLEVSLDPIALPPALAARARGVDADPLNPMVPHTGRNLLKGRLRSHPEVTRRFYADLA
ncbi:isopenicillin N synthase family dioxygenase [Hydrogenophaga sp. MI9]|uniref:isopenicillin N synthase family dioxygenase n=1 Tax=Hydrogenophaga sp. MI9 TaxID=3453719 RepID=UPI003EEEA5C1